MEPSQSTHAPQAGNAAGAGDAPLALEALRREIDALDEQIVDLLGQRLRKVQRVVAIKNLTINEPFFQGHFPGDPVMPGVLQVEAMAQCGGVLVNRMLKKEGVIAYFLAIDNARFRRPCIPGDQLLFEVTFTRARLGMVKLHGTAKVNGELASEADLMFAYKAD